MTTTQEHDAEIYDDLRQSDDRVNILIAFDAESILKKFGENDKPNDPQKLETADADKYITMLVREKNAIRNLKGSALHVKVEPDQHIRWRDTSLSLNSNYIVLMYKYDPNGEDKKVIEKPQLKEVSTLKVPQPNTNDPLNPTMQTIKSYFWEALALKNGSQDYHFWFMILFKSGKKLGYFRWDPTVVVESPT
jgi:hypothetical protein